MRVDTDTVGVDEQKKCDIRFEDNLVLRIIDFGEKIVVRDFTGDSGKVEIIK